MPSAPSTPHGGDRGRELAAVDGIGAVIAASVAEFLAMPTNQTVLERLRAAGVAAEEPGAGGRGRRAGPGSRGR